MVIDDAAENGAIYLIGQFDNFWEELLAERDFGLSAGGRGDRFDGGRTPADIRRRLIFSH